MSQVLYPTNNYLPHPKSSITATSSKASVRTSPTTDESNGAPSHRAPLATPLGNSNGNSSNNNGSGSGSSSSALTASRPRRAAALASQAATTAVVETSRRKSSLNSNKSNSNPSSKPTPNLSQPSDTTAATQTPKVDNTSDNKPTRNGSGGGGQQQQQQQPQQRVMAALPRSKRPRRGAAPVEESIAAKSSHHPNSNGTALNGKSADMTSSSSKAGIMMGIDSALQAGYSNGNVYGGGSDPVPNDPYYVSIPISASSSSTSRLGNATSGSVREVINGQETEVFVIDSNSPPPNNTYNDSNAHPNARGKRKAIASPNGAVATAPSAASASMSAAAAAKRRKKDGAEPGGSTAAMPAYDNNKSGVYQDYAGVPSASARVNNVPSYRGGYNANYNYQSPNGARWADHPSNYFTERPGQPIDDEEGHYIIREGNLVAQRYAIKNLLGQGTFGKVVRCKDTQRDREVAIKIIRSIQKYTDAAQIEIRVLKALRDNDPRNENKCIHLIDTFSHHNHVCIVSELLGKSVFDFLKENQFFPFPCKDIWSFAKQLLRSVAFLHDLGLVHTDLKPENILLVNNDFDLVPLTKRANARKKRVLRDSEIRLIDFGSATFNDEYHSQVVSTRHYRAPEIILQMGWSFPCDAWSIGCILIEFYTGEALFQTHDNLEHLAMMETVLGLMPDDFRRKAETYRPGYFYAGRLDFPNAQTNKQSRKFVKAMKTIDQTVNSGVAYSKHDQRFIHLLKRLLTFDPAQRIRVDQALKHPYFDLTANEIPP